MNATNRSLSSLELACVAKGLRMTEQRRLLARLLSTTKDHPDIEEVHRRALKIDPSLSLSTVYRTLRLFNRHTIIELHSFGQGRARFEPRSHKHHDHIINVKTGALIEFHSEEIERLQAEIAAKLGYKLIDHRLELFCEPLEE